MVSVQDLKSGGRLVLAVLLCSHVSVAAFAADGSDADVAAHMHQHLSAMRAMKVFIVAGQLDGMREPAVWLEEHQATPGLPGDWQSYVMQLRRYAGEAAAARHLDSGAALVSEMARVCGDCHAANSVEADLDDGDSLPPDMDSVTLQMQRHMWAVDRMWVGLISPSDAAWVEGAAVLATIRLTPADIGLSEANEPKLSYLLDRAREIGVQGELADGRQARSELYGELLGLCADCHSLTGGGPAR
jgi:hypothetical protein